MKIWSNSGDSHYNEPPDLYDTLAPSLRERMPRSVKSEDGSYETIYVDGTSFQRPMPRIGVVKGAKGRTLAQALQAPGAADFTVRRNDLDDEGIWAEVIYASVGFWNSMITDPVLIREATKAVNDWSASVQQASIRHVMPKNAVEHMTRGMAAEVGDKGITVNCIAPGISAFEAANSSLANADAVVAGNAVKRMGTSRDLYAAMAYLCSSGADWVTGQTLRVDGGAGVG